MNQVASSKQKVASKISKFTDLIAWQKAHELVIEIYRNTEDFPVSEQFGLTSQMRRAAVSITSNIAEGFSRGTNKDKIHFYKMGQGSLTELQNQILIARDVGFNINFIDLSLRSIEVHKIMTGLIKSIQVKL